MTAPPRGFFDAPGAQLALLDRLFEGAPEAIALLDRDERVMRANAEFLRLFEYSAAEVAGRVLNDLIVGPEMREQAEVLTAQARDGIRFEVESVRRTRSGRSVPVAIRGLPIEVDGAQVGVWAMYRDLSHTGAVATGLAGAAMRDPLTGLPNRALFREHLSVALQRARRRRRRAAVLVAAADQLRMVEETHGAVVADELLRAVAERLHVAVRREDTLSVYARGEFAVVLSDLQEASDAMRLADRIHAGLRERVRVDGEEVFVSVSIGISVGAEAAADPEQLVRDAFGAMHRAMYAGGGTSRVFDQGVHRAALGRLRLEAELREAVERGEITSVYQPIVRLPGGEIAGFEALARWNHPQRGVLQPHDFISIAEKTGLIVGVGLEVLRQAAHAAGEWLRVAGRVVTAHVNLSPVQLLDPGLLEAVEEILASARVPASSMVFEVTESVVLHGPEAAAVLGRLRALGVQLHLDDFGTGYSGLTYLQQLPVAGIKLDRSFISRLGDGADAEGALVRGVIDLAHGLGLHVVAEGVETSAQSRLAGALGADYAQGFLYAHPRVLSETTPLLLGPPLGRAD
ncbi:MAG TPA: EAL domain-containing protein [Longimicrobium sp.]|nr:EAL domain-containing protein [Longimicrobium sp.]